jgi:hypothetical protein
MSSGLAKEIQEARVALERTTDYYAVKAIANRALSLLDELVAASDTEAADAIEWGELPPSKKERVIRMIPQIEAMAPKWGRLPADITTAVVNAAAAERGIALDVATRKRDGETRVWARIRVADTAKL